MERKDENNSVEVLTNRQKWEHCSEVFIRKSLMGLGFGILAGIPGMVKYRMMPLLGACVGLGFGMGSSYTQAVFAFEQDVYLNTPWIIRLGSEVSQNQIDFVKSRLKDMNKQQDEAQELEKEEKEEHGNGGGVEESEEEDVF